MISPNPESGPERWRDNFVLANNLLHEAGVDILHYYEEYQCPAELAKFAEQNG